MDKTEEILAHFGVQGMKWGVRKGASGKIKPRATLSLLDRHEQKWIDNANTKVYARVYRKAAGKIRKGTRLINNDPKFKGKSFKKDSPLRREYYDAYSKMVTSQLNAAVGQRRIVNPLTRVGQSPLRKFELKFEFDVSKELRPTATIRRADTMAGRKQQRKESALIRKFKHSDEPDTDVLEVLLTFDELDHIVDIDVPEEEEVLKQSMDETEQALAHFGIPGMRWGIRRGSSKATGGKITKAKVSTDDKKDDAPALNGVRTPTSRVPAKDLSDNDLRARISRIQMEQQYSQLTKTKVQKGKEVLTALLVGAATKQAATYVNKYVGEGMDQAMKKAMPAIKKALNP